MSEYNKEHPQEPLRVLDKTSIIGKIAIEFAFGASIVSELALILIFLRIFSNYATIVCIICLVILFIASVVFLVDMLKFNQLN